jgi:hypothetical protein
VEVIMSLRSSLAILTVLGTLTGVAAAAAPGAESSCLGGHAVTKVVPHRAAVYAGQGPHQKLVGARLFVPAQPGLTAEWLEAELERRASTPEAAGQCPLDVPGARVDVRSGGPGFWVTVSARDDSGAREVLRRAEALTR